jgi:hypothetical protein
MKLRPLFTFSAIEWLQICGFFMLTAGLSIVVLIGIALIFNNAPDVPMPLVWSALGVIIGLGAFGALLAHLINGLTWLRGRMSVGRLRLSANPSSAQPGQVVTLTLLSRDVDLSGRKVVFSIAYEAYVDEAPNQIISQNKHPIDQAPPGKILRAEVIVPHEVDANSVGCSCIAYAIVDDNYAVSAKTELKMLLADGVEPAPGVLTMLKEMLFAKPKK